MRLPPVAPAAVLLVATAVAANYATAGLRPVERDRPAPATRAPDPPPELARPASPAPPPESGSSVLGDAVLVGLLAAVLALLVAGGWVLVRLLRRSGWWSGARRRYRLRRLRPAGTEPAAGGPPAAEVLAAVDEAVARSEDDPDPRRAVIACWVRLAEAAGEAGVPRHDSDTATDLVLRMLRGHRVSEPVLAAFVEAYWLARYTTHAVDEQLRTRARTALRQLRAELRGELAATPGRSP